MTGHRGPHPADAELFDDVQLPALRTATEELSWLLGRGYATTGAVALVGNRHSLRSRQRLAVQRASCSDGERANRASRRITEASALKGRALLLDGFNVVIALEAALSGGVLIVGRDGALRDMSSVHGNYRRVVETRDAVAHVARALETAAVASVGVYLDRPVSNSGRLAAIIRETLGEHLTVTVELCNDPDRRLIADGGDAIVCTGDGAILNRCGAWLDLPALVIASAGIEHWRVAL